MQAAIALWKSMSGMNGIPLAPIALAGQFTAALGWVAVLLGLALVGPNTQQLMSYSRDNAVDSTAPMPQLGLRWAVAAGILFGASIMAIVMQRPTEFLYFRF